VRPSKSGDDLAFLVTASGPRQRKELAMATTVADVMVATLKASGVQRVYGIPGDSLNGFTDAMRRDGGITWEHSRHEEGAAFAAAAEAANAASSRCARRAAAPATCT
jgi:pyruvate dehydrogenase (quinone)